MAQKIIYTANAQITANLFGAFDSNIDRLEQVFSVRIYNQQQDGTAGDAAIIEGDDEGEVERAAKAVEMMKNMCDSGDALSTQSVDYIIAMVKEGSEKELKSLEDACICITNSGKPIKAKTVGQKRYVDAIKENTVVLGVGPAGTGKTFLAVAMAVKALRAKEVNRIVLTRPAVEAGESLGYLPGDLQSKIDPYLRPLYDAL